jgi:hypothetical protein
VSLNGPPTVLGIAFPRFSTMLVISNCRSLGIKNIKTLPQLLYNFASNLIKTALK